MKNILFVCSLNRIRSLTAEMIFKDKPGIKVRSAGTQKNARVVIGLDLLRWADQIFVMEKGHKEKIEFEFGPQNNITVLDIPNGFEYMEQDLIQMITEAMKPYFS